MKGHPFRRMFQLSPLRLVALGFAVVASGAAIGAVQDSATATAPAVKGPRHTGLIVPSWEPEGYESPELATTLDTIKALGLQRVTFISTWYQATLTSSTFARSEATPTDSALRTAIAAARSRGLRVALKPHVDLPDDSWRGDIKPADRAAWFANYQSFVNTYAELAQETGATTFIVGTELASLSTDPRWTLIISDVRSRFSGTLTYAANWDEAPQIRFWNLLDEIGIDAYYPLTANQQGTTSVNELRNGWKTPKQQLAKLATRWKKPVRFTEVGYTRHRGTTATPWDFTLQSPARSAEQAAAYEALFQAMRSESWFLGPDFWATDPPAEEHDELGYSPLGHPAQSRLAAGAATLAR